MERDTRNQDRDNIARVICIERKIESRERQKKRENFV